MDSGREHSPTYRARIICITCIIVITEINRLDKFSRIVFVFLHFATFRGNYMREEKALGMSSDVEPAEEDIFSPVTSDKRTFVLTVLPFSRYALPDKLK